MNAIAQPPTETPAPAVPLLSLRGRVLAGLGAAVAAILALVHLGLTGRGFVGAFFAAVLVVLAAVDVERRIIPNRIVLPATGIVFVAQVVLDPGRAWEYAVAGLAAALFLLVPGLISAGAVGMGDVKLALFLGVGLGKDVLTAGLIGIFAGAAYAILLLLRDGRSARSRAIAYGPFLAAGGIVALLVS